MPRCPIRVPRVVLGPLALCAVAALVFALGTGVAGAAKGGNSANAKKCQGTGYLNWVTTSGTTFNSAGACTAYAAQGGILVAKPVTHRLTVTVTSAALGNVSVTSAPAGIDCVAAEDTVEVCTYDFAAGTSVTLTEHSGEGPGSRFLFWSGACSNTESTCTVTMDSDQNVGADFDV